MYDIFYLGNNQKLVTKFPTAKRVNSIQQAQQLSLTKLFWFVWNDVTPVDNFLFDIYFSIDNTYDNIINHVFLHDDNGEILKNSIWLLSKTIPISKDEIDYRYVLNAKEWDIVASTPMLYDKFIINSYDDYLNAFEQSTTEMFWCIPDDIAIIDDSIFNLTYTVKNSFDTRHDFDRNINHVYKNGDYHDGVILCSVNCKISSREFNYGFIVQKKEVDIVASLPSPYDIVFISYQESNADKNYAALKERFPHAKRINGVKGIHQAHVEAAKLCNTDMFWIVDGDASIVNSFNFDYQVPKWQRDQVFVWQSQNPINDLVYGYGGVKLFPRNETINMDVNSTDMTTSISSKFNAVDQLSNITAFNTSEFETWKSAFRECAKLSSKIIDRQNTNETEHRLKIWCTVGADRLYGKYAISGANAGKKFGISNAAELNLINNFDWLEKQFIKAA